MVGLTWLSSGVPVCGGDPAPGPAMEAFEARAGRVSQLAETGKLPEASAVEVEGLRRTLREVLEAHEREVMRLEAQILTATDEEARALLDRLVEVGAERERAVARHMAHVEGILRDRAGLPTPRAVRPSGTSDARGEEDAETRIELRFEPEDVEASPLE